MLISVIHGLDGKHAATIDTRLYLPANATVANPQPATLMTNELPAGGAGGRNRLDGGLAKLLEYQGSRR